MGGFKLGVSLDRAPRMLQTIVLETLAGIEDLELVHMPAGEYAPDCRAVILIDDERPEAHLRARVECVINLDPETAEGWLYLDFSRCYPPEDGRSYEWFDEPRLRDVRRAENRFELLPFAHWCVRPEESDPGGQEP